MSEPLRFRFTIADMLWAMIWIGALIVIVPVYPSDMSWLWKPEQWLLALTLHLWIGVALGGLCGCVENVPKIRSCVIGFGLAATLDAAFLLTSLTSLLA